MKASAGDNSLALQRFLFTYRVTPHATTGQAPCELLQGKKLRTLLDLIRPDVRSTVSRSQFRQKENYDRKTRQRDFAVGQKVWVKTYGKNAPKWSSGVITKQLGPVTFLVDVSGEEFKRHADQILNAPPHDWQIGDDDTAGAARETPAPPTPRPSPRKEGGNGGTPPSPPQEFKTPIGSPARSPERVPTPIPAPPPMPQAAPPTKTYPQRERKPAAYYQHKM